jgi:short-subunit dehydrogenase
MSPLANSSVYSSTKVAVRQWAEGLRAELAADNIGVSIVCPGYVESRMTAANRFHMPMKLSSQEASAKIREGIEYDLAYICFPSLLTGLCEGVQSMPGNIKHWMTEMGLLKSLSLSYRRKRRASSE